MAADPPRIHFVLDALATRWPDIVQLDESDIDRAPWRFVGGRNSWIAQSFLRLRRPLEAHGWRVSAGPGFPRDAICIAHRDDVNRFDVPAHASFLVVVRADRPPVAACDFAVAQNALRLREGERFIPLWPQPGLAPRDAARGVRLERIAYHGRTSSAPAWFRDRGFHRALEARGVRFEVKRRSDWSDYRHVDVVLAAREEKARVLAQKPATKVYNGWLARAPVLASPEPAYRAVRQSALDFIEIDDDADVVQAIDRLKANPALFQAMVANGAARAREFCVDAVRERWLAVLTDEVVPAFLAARRTLPWRRPWFLAAMARQKALGKMYRLRLTLEPRPSRSTRTLDPRALQAAR